MKVVLVTPYSWTSPGGVNNHIRSLARELRLRGHEVRILAPADGKVEPGVIPLGRTIGVPYNGSIARLAFGPRVAGRVRVALRRARPDVVHVHEPFAPSVSLLATMTARAPLVATFHVAADSRVYRAARAPLRPLWRKIAVKVAVSAAARDTVEAVFGPGARVIPNGVETAAYAAIPPVDPGSNVVLFFGRLERRKGPQVLIEALPRLRALAPQARVVIAGDGPLRRELEDAIAPAHRPAVNFVGAFDDQDRIALLSSATVACLPAIGGESFGITLLEAMAAGRPVVASSIPGYAAVARAGIEAILVPPGDAGMLAEAVARLLGDPDLLRQMGEAGRRRATRFDWKAVASEVEEIYHEALDARARPAPARFRRLRLGPR